jgi:60 kDa SS-A/Ro ribonucleoprotein
MYCTERELTIENAQCVLRCCKEDGKRTVARIVEISEAGRAPKNDPAIFALAICAGQKIPEALEALPRVCRIGTHIFQFVEAVEKFRGHGRSLNRALKRWYTDKEPSQAAFQAMKFQQRNGWSHRDILRLCKPKAEGDMNTVFHWITKGWDSVGEVPHERDALKGIWAFERAKRATEKKEICRLIREYNLPRECVPTQFLKEADVWEALLEKMPMHAMVRNLATMTRVGLLSPMSKGVGKGLSELTNSERIKKSRLHPIAILAAMLTYKQGHGERGQNVWNPVSQIVDALDGAFYLAFQCVEPTNKRWMLALDVSGSMDQGMIAGIPGLSPRMGSAAMALVTAATEPQHMFVAFTSNGWKTPLSGRSRFEGQFNGMTHIQGDGITPLTFSPRQRIDDVCNQTRALPMGGTDCALPMLYAMENRIEVDAFVLLTDSETYAGSCAPSQALDMYRQKMGIPAKMIVCGMVSNGFSVADKEDAFSLDCVGFSTDTPAVMANFVR